MKEMETEVSKEMGAENGVEMKREVKKKGTVDKTPTSSGAGKLEARPEEQMLNSAIKDYCFISDISFSDLAHEYELETDFVLTEKANLVLADPP